MFQYAYKRKNGSYVNETARQKAEQLQKEVQDGCPENEAFIRMFGKEHPERVRGMGSGVTPSKFLGDSSFGNSKLQAEMDALKAAHAAEINALNVKMEANQTKMKADQEELRKQMTFILQHFPRNGAVELESLGSLRRSSVDSAVHGDGRAGSSDANI